MAATCSERIMQEGGWGMRNCSRKPVVWEDEKGYCKQHSPEKKQDRYLEMERRDQERRDNDHVRQEKHVYAMAASAYCQVKGLTLPQLLAGEAPDAP